MKIIEYIENNCWCNFKNNNRTLFYRSIYNYGTKKYKNKVIQNKITETITLYYPKNQRQIHGFNGNQPPIDANSLKKISLSRINNFIYQYQHIREQIENLSQKMKMTNNFLNASKVKEIIELEAKLYSYEYLISNLATNKNEAMSQKQYENFCKWKNNPQNKELWIYPFIFQEVLKSYNIAISIQTFKQYIHFQELLDLLEKKQNIYTIIRNIKKREKNGFLFLNFRNYPYQNKVITNTSILKKVTQYINQLEQNAFSEINELVGIPTYPFKILEGTCFVMKDSNFTNEDIFNKIVICPALTTQDIINLLDCRAILVEYGGYLSHASIWSREYHKPCLVNCKNITNFLKTGDTIQIDGDTGKIEFKQKNDY